MAGISLMISEKFTKMLLEGKDTSLYFDTNTSEIIVAETNPVSDNFIVIYSETFENIKDTKLLFTDKGIRKASEDNGYIQTEKDYLNNYDCLYGMGFETYEEWREHCYYISEYIIQSDYISKYEIYINDLIINFFKSFLIEYPEFNKTVQLINSHPSNCF